MFNALKRITNTNKNGTNTNNNGSNSSTKQQNGMQAISQTLQKKFAKGVNYNMKIVIRGDCNTGKTCLWLRLQGKPFKESYEPTDEIQISNINWNYKLSDTDIVKVEIWDVVDKSRKKRQLSNGLKIENSANVSQTSQQIEASLDAEFIDVYKNCNGCILVYDITKHWTWEYIERELPRIPAHIPVLILGNHLDMQHHRTIAEMKCRYFIESLNRGSMGSIIRYIEASMRNGFGLTYLYKFLNLPFLQLQRETIMQQLEINAKEIDCMNEELGLVESNVENDYEFFQNNLNQKRRVQSENLAADALKNAKTVDEAREEAAKAAKAAALETSQQMNDGKKIINSIIDKINPVMSKPNVAMSKSTPNQHVQLDKKKTLNPLEEILPGTLDEFNTFLNDSKGSTHQIDGNHSAAHIFENDEDDDDKPTANPMVFNIKELSSSDDEEKQIPIEKPKNLLQANTIEAKHLGSSNYSRSSHSDSDDKFKNHKANEAKSTDNDFILIKSGDQFSLNSIMSNKPRQVTSFMINEFDGLSLDPKVKFTSDDFEFLEKMSTNVSPSVTSTIRDANEKGNRVDKSKKKKVHKSSTKKDDTDSATTNTDYDNAKKKKKNSKKQLSDSLNDDDSGQKIKTNKTKLKTKKNKSLSIIGATNDDVDDIDDGIGGVHIKPDCDYEEI